jgi:L-threonylcarbamoyladenylate synthase
VTLLRVDPADPDADAIALAAAAVAAGQLVVLPTDSVYGLGADPTLPAAVDRVFAAKGRPRDLSLPVLVAGLAHVDRIAVLDARARRAIAALWPGAVTLVLRRKPAVSWDLGRANDTLALRMPDHRVALDLLTQTGPLAVTSANRSGRPTPADCAEVAEILGDAVSVYLDAGPSPSQIPSTIVDLSGPEPVLLREGAIPAGHVLEVLGG